MAKKKFQREFKQYFIKATAGDTTYPADLSGDSDYVQFSAFPYEANRSSRRGGQDPTQGGKVWGCKLYMPNSTPRSNSEQEWEGKAFPGEKGMLQKELMRGMTGGDMNLTGIDYGEGAKQMFLDKVLGEFGYDAATAMSLSGKQYNPNIEMLYKNPKLRPFDFTFIFAPKNEADSRATDKIIQGFKQYSAPQMSGGNKGYMILPHLFHIKYMKGSGGELDKMTQFKNLALMGVSHQDNPTQDMHMTFTDGTPAVTAMSLSFMETDFVTHEQHASKIRGY